MRWHQVEHNDDDMSKSDREESQEEIVVLYSSSLEQFSWVFIREVIELVHSKDAGCSEVRSWIDVLKAKPLPEVVFEISSFQIVDHFFGLI